MISLIICSRSKRDLRRVNNNIAQTIGVPYEIISIDNSGNNYNIFQAYNIGIKRSKYDLLCFMHEDVSFNTFNWGQIVSSCFRVDPRLGLLGVAGGGYKTLMPSGWWCAAYDPIKINIIQHYKSGKQASHVLVNSGNESVSKVVAIDGVWFCTPKHLAEKIKFDEHTFTGFHCYDVDYSLSVLQASYDVAVTFEILLNHFSEGSMDASWLDATLKLHAKWNRTLPKTAYALTATEQARLERKAFEEIIPRLAGRQAACLKFLRLLSTSKMARLIGIRSLLFMQLVLLKKIIKGA